MTKCITCQTLALDPAEPEMHRLIRIYEDRIDELSNRLVALDAIDKYAMQERIEYLELIISNHRSRK